MSSIIATLMRPLREAVVTMLAALATLACAMAIDPEPGPAVLAVVLCLSFARSHLDRDLRGRLEAAIALPVVGLVAVGVGTLLHRVPWLGALVFVAGMSVSIWLRRFGPLARRAGSLIALPFVVILTTPYVPTRHAGHAMALVIPIVVSLLALVWVMAFQALARGVRWLPARAGRHVEPAAPAQAGSLRPVASTRMAVQMAIALTLSFVVGYTFFAERWAWIVLTAFIVNSGNRGRLDVAYKSVLRVLGAAAGTIMALLLAFHAGSHDATTVGLILAAVFLGMWLRPLGYAWWALFVTLALALLQGFEGTSAQHILWPRLTEIVIGAIIGVASAWFVLPVRSSGVVRRRIADALAILSDALDPATPARGFGEFLAAVDPLWQVLPAFRASRLVTRHFRSVQPADWIDTLLACREPAVRAIKQGPVSGSVRKAVGDARKALRNPGELLSALQHLRQSLVAGTPGHALAVAACDEPLDPPAGVRATTTPSASSFPSPTKDHPMTMTLYYTPGACSMSDHIVLQWIGQPYVAQKMTKEGIKTPEYLKLNPAGAVPVLEVDGWALTQNVAILNYLADTFPEAKLGGDGTPKGRAEVNRWLSFLNADVHPTFHPLFGSTSFLDDAGVELSKQQARAKLRELLGRADQQLQGRDWLAGTRSIADPYLFVELRWAKATNVDLSGFDHLARFGERMLADSDVQKVLADEGLGKH